MKNINLEIFTENEDLYDNIVELICRKDKKFNRDLSIEKILNGKEDKKDKFYLDGLFGEVYENDIVNYISLSKVTHVIKSISFNKNRFTSEVIILNTFSGKSVQLYAEESLRLRPVYQPYTNKLISFNIEMITINQVA